MRFGLVFATAMLCSSACTEDPSGSMPETTVQFQRASSDLVSHGKRVADVLGCTDCHGADLAGRDWSEPGFGRLWTANLTRIVPRYTDEQLENVIRSGARPDRELWGMPSHLFTHLTPDDMSALIAYMRSVPASGVVHPDPVFEEGARREITAGIFTSSATQVRNEGSSWPTDAGEPYALGRYIVRATCAECHGISLRGEPPNSDVSPPPDLRMVAGYELEQFRRLLQTGIAVGNRDVGLMSRVAQRRFVNLTDSEIDAVHRYLQRVAQLDP